MRHIYKGGRGSNGLFMEYSVKLKPEVNILELGEKCSDVCTFTTKRHIRKVHEIIEFMCDRCEYDTFGALVQLSVPLEVKFQNGYFLSKTDFFL